MPAHRTQNTRRLHVEATPIGAPPINIISPTPQTFVFPDTDTINALADASSYSFTTHPSHSLPNLFAFHASPDSGLYSSYADQLQSYSPTSSQASMYSTYTDSPTSISGSSFASPPNSLYGSSPPASSGTPSLSPSPPPAFPSPTHSHATTVDHPAPYPHPLPPHSNGQVRTQPPRPPNPWICFRNVRSAQYKSSGEFPKLAETRTRGHSAPSSPAAGTVGLDGEARRPRQADLSKHISLEWKALTDEEKAPYVRMSEEAKVMHARIYPGYKYQPRRKGESAGTRSAAEAAKKSRSKKAGKGSKKKEREREVDVEADGEPETDSDAPLIRLPSLDIDISAHAPEAGDHSKDWTWLPEQTLFPVSWPGEPEPGCEDVMHALDANVEGDENEEAFGKHFFFSFPPLAPSADQDESVDAPFFPFPAAAESDPASFADPNYDFQASASDSALGLQDVRMDADAADLTNAFDFGLAHTGTGYDAEYSFTPANVEELAAFSVGDTLNAAPRSQDHCASPPPVPPPSPPPAPVQPRRRRSVATPSHCTSADGHLRPPHITLPRSRPRGLTMPAPRATPHDRSCEHAVRSIPTANFNFSAGNGISTSVLIPSNGILTSVLVPRHDTELERDLAAYNHAVGTVEFPSRARSQSSSPATPPASSTGTKPAPRCSENLEDDDLDLNVEFDFEAEFGDIIDIHAARGRPSST